MTATKRLILAAVGVPLMVVIAACGQDATDSPADLRAAEDLETIPQVSLVPEPAAEVDAANLAAPAAGADLPQRLVVPVVTDRLVATKIPRMGTVVTDTQGYVLYRFDKDSAKPPTSRCVDACAAMWPPVLTEGGHTVEGISPNLVGTLAHADGLAQLTLGGWPLYRYAGDPQPGTWKGQMVNGTWFVIAPDGKKNLSCLPTTTPTAAPVPEQPSVPEPEVPPGNTGGY